MTVLKKLTLAFPIHRVLMAAALSFVCLLIAFPVSAQAASSTTAEDTFFYTRERANAPIFQGFAADSTKDLRTLFTLKKNILYDLAGAINFEAEIPVLDRYSLLLEYVFPWWETGYKFCEQMVEFGPEVRFWFNSWERESRDKMIGWFVGVYGMSAKYDFQFDTKLNYQGEYYSVGISAGYIHKLKNLSGRPTNARLEFSLAAGFLQTDFRHYLPTDDYTLLIRDKYNVGRVSYFGPTKAKISIVVPIFVNNDNLSR
ncbi:MAG: DUF3575 domain-containing protein [Bacteroidales bacterium]|nr:DUF3575 domain-containing protein [Bacteroidales bacterium]